MLFLYNLGIFFYGFLARLLALWNPKAKLYIVGRNNIFSRIEQALQQQTKPLAWFHCASLGEFEQAKPVIEAFRKKYPDFFIFLTFFSPSGYEIRKNYAGADAIFYLPTDTQANARRFISRLKPDLVCFVKYDLWYHYLTELKKRQIKTILFSAIFRQNQLFFKSYGHFYRNILACFNHIFVQNDSSLVLLQSIGITQTSVAGDTRFDSVAENFANKKEILIAEKFKDGKKLLIVGSCWEADLTLIIDFISQFSYPLKIIIAPHEIKEWYFSKIEKEVNKKSVRFSQADVLTIAKAEILLIDNVGMLANLYKYGDFAYVGGGFGEGLQNFLETAVFG
ncbi:MAG: 3-deoxy-D-manno-octulosonic acid transferase, partial [Verrucomicrobia bacterium]|nr:3-deoxy-D-manno-octulosonic acid transferase [Cytophagales bacterium]